MLMPDTRQEADRIVEALKKWADNHPHAAAALFLSPEEFAEQTAFANEEEQDGYARLDRDEREDAICYVDADIERERLLRELKSPVAAE